LHSEGRLGFSMGRADTVDTEDQIPIEALKAQCAKREDGTAYYNKFRQYGINYGPSFQPIQEIYIHDSFALSKLKIADPLKNDFGQFILHPSMIDGALQTVAGLVEGLGSAAPHLPFALDEVDILHPMRQVCYAYAEFAGSREQNYTGVRKFNIRLLNESGDVLINFKNLFARAIPTAHKNPRSVETARLSAAAGV
ncbi:MAG TPA: polyketide synthase dehydratase domain-containing protein, partial [Verrucomicrobiae bacterium]|nr:polyketide synthase dehydratase domain-containing protein [Verrucomicrobiae bacterium]